MDGSGMSWGAGEGARWSGDGMLKFQGNWVQVTGNCPMKAGCPHPAWLVILLREVTCPTASLSALCLPAGVSCGIVTARTLAPPLISHAPGNRRW